MILLDGNIISNILNNANGMVFGINIVSFILLLVFLYPLLIGFLFKLNSEALLNTIKSLFSTLSLLLSLIFSSILVKNIFILDKYNVMTFINTKITPTLGILIEKRPQFTLGVLTLLILMIIYQILRLLLDLVSDVALAPLLGALDNLIKRGGNGFKRIFGLIFQIPKAFCYAIILTFVLNYASMLNINREFNYVLESSKIYSFFTEKVVIPITKSEVARSLPNVLNDSFKVYDPKKGNIDFNNIGISDIVYYNGVTLEEGIKSNKEINGTALEIASKYKTTADKAKAIYKWVGSEISYDDDKAVQVMNNQKDIESGAIPTFYSRKGVCFDYACLYVAMCRANNIKVRLIVGEGFNGKTWVSHAWNEVYVEEESRWINVDPTFYIGGNYFDSERFKLDHKNRKLAGEW